VKEVIMTINSSAGALPHGGDDTDLFKGHAACLRTAAGASVRTSPPNVEDACGFAWQQLVRHRPHGAVAFAWLRTIAVCEAIKLHRRTARTAGLDLVADVADPVARTVGRVELIATGEQIRAARRRPREARVLGLRAAGYSREDVAELTGDSERRIDRQLGRARRKLRRPAVGPLLARHEHLGPADERRAMRRMHVSATGPSPARGRR
jgi:DNA-directed RNA polymerase specialized sigma24 family protein